MVCLWHLDLKVLEKEGRGENLQILCSHKLNPKPIYTTGHVLHIGGEHCWAPVLKIWALKASAKPFLTSWEQLGAYKLLTWEGSSVASGSSVLRQRECALRGQDRPHPCFHTLLFQEGGTVPLAVCAGWCGSAWLQLDLNGTLTDSGGKRQSRACRDEKVLGTSGVPLTGLTLLV